MMVSNYTKLNYPFAYISSYEEAKKVPNALLLHCYFFKDFDGRYVRENDDYKNKPQNPQRPTATTATNITKAIRANR